LAAFSALKRIATCFARAIELWLSGAQASKHFFFEKKKQKTFDFWKQKLAKDASQEKSF
jgi:hypothetical protein